MLALTLPALLLLRSSAAYAQADGFTLVCGDDERRVDRLPRSVGELRRLFGQTFAHAASDEHALLVDVERHVSSAVCLFVCGGRLDNSSKANRFSSASCDPHLSTPPPPPLPSPFYPPLYPRIDGIIG